MLFLLKIKESLKFVVPVICLFLGLGLGWKLKPDQVKLEEKVKVVEVEKQIVVTQEKTVVQIIKVKDTQINDKIHKERTEERKIDGSIIVKEIEDRNITSVVKEKENNTEVKVIQVEKQIVVEKEVQKIVKIDPVLPQWKIGVLGGMDLKTNLVLGGEVERRILGPIWMGVWVDGTKEYGQGGLKFSVEF